MNRFLVVPLCGLLLSGCTAPAPLVDQTVVSAPAAKFESSVQAQGAPAPVEDWVRESESLFRNGKLDQALALLDKAIAEVPCSGSLRTRRGRVQSMRNEPLAALKDFDQAGLINPLDGDVQFQRGLRLSALRRYPEAVEALSRASELMPLNAQILAVLGSVLYEVNQYDEALAALGESLRLEAGNANAWWEMGFILERLLRPLEAMDSYGKAIQLNPGRAIYFKYRGSLRRSLGLYAEAIEDLRKAQVLDSGDESIHLQLSRTYEGLGNMVESEHEMDAYGKACGEDSYSQYQRGLRMLRLGNPAEAIRFLETAAAGDLSQQTRLYAVLRVYLLRKRLGQEADPVALLACFAGLKSDDWSHAVASFVLGRISEAELFLLAAEGKTAAEREDYLCDAHYYSGILQVAGGNSEAGLRHLQACVATRALNSPERSLALSELKLKAPTLDLTGLRLHQPMQPTLPVFAQKPGQEWAATLRMVAAHAALRTPEFMDPSSVQNVRTLEALLRKSFLGPVAVLEPAPTIPAPPDKSIVGSLPGHFSLDAFGTASYSIDLPIPQGRGGLNPNLSLWYSSDVGEGQLGVGFGYSTSFTKSIIRGRTLLARDGVARMADYAVDDHFYFGGKRLICIDPPGTSGLPGSHYRTEVDGFMLFTALGKGNRIEGFEVKDSKGWTYHYGKYKHEEDGFQPAWDEASGRLADEACCFALKRAEDERGNWIDFRYRRGGAGEWALASILYAGGPAIAPGFEICFQYEDRRNRIGCLQNGYRADQTLLLVSIQAFALDGEARTQVGSFDLGYEHPDAWSLWRLTSLGGRLCADVGEPLQSLRPTLFAWSGAERPDRLGCLSPLFSGIPCEREGEDWLIADFNNDGKPDLLDARAGLRMHLSSSEGLPSTGKEWIDEKSLQDLGFGVGRRFFYAYDYDGDRAKDLLLFDGQSRILLLKAREGLFEAGRPCDIGRWLGAPQSDQVSTDVHAVGRALAGRLHALQPTGLLNELVLVHGLNGDLWRLRPLGDSFEAEEVEPVRLPSFTQAPTRAQFLTSRLQTFVQDFNEDGLDDYAWVETSRIGVSDRVRNELWLCLSRPHGGMSAPLLLDSQETRAASLASADNQASCSYRVLCDDLNSDGYIDFLIYAKPADEHLSPQWRALHLRGLSTERVEKGENPVQVVKNPLPAVLRLKDGEISCGADEAQAQFLLQDLNQDGCAELIFFKAGSGASGRGAWWVCRGLDGRRFADPEPLLGSFWESLAERKEQQLAQDPRGSIQLRITKDPQGLGQVWRLVLQSGEGRGDTLLGMVGTKPWSARCPFPNLVTDIHNGLGARLAIGYRAGNDDALVEPGVMTRPPIVRNSSSLPIVSDQWKDNGGSKPSQFSYVYAGRRLDLSGRGAMSYNAMCTVDRCTGCLNYQFLEASFPMNGLTRREENYIVVAREPGRLGLHLLSRIDNSNGYDAVSAPERHSPLGTLFPFEVETKESRTPDNDEIHFWLPCSSLDAFLPRDPPASLARSHLVYTLYDWQPGGSKSMVFQPEPFEVNWLDPLGSVWLPEVAGQQFPSRITRGDKSMEVEVTSGKPVHVRYRELESMPWPVNRLRMAVEVDSGDVVSEETSTITTIRHWCGSSLPELRTSETRKGSLTTLSETRYIRDEKGRLLQKQQTNAETARSEGPAVVYQAGKYDERLDLAGQEYEDDTRIEECSYNSLFNEARLIAHASGDQVEVSYDPLGRIIRVSNPKASYLRTVEREWTRPENTGWTRQQLVVGPEEAHGQIGVSVYALRTSTTGKPRTIEYHDCMDRVIRTITETLDGRILCSDSVYNEFKQLVACTDPCASGDMQKWKISTYDVYGREKN